ncbi:MAG TPA: DUF4215 domain-containing protein [Candidatus Binatia bacterium]|jgi:cysteine-rich repeat protein
MKKPRARLLAKLLVATSLVLAGVPLAANEAGAQQVIGQDVRCRESLSAANNRYVNTILFARIRCVNRIIKGEIPATTDCLHGQSDARLASSIANAQDKLSNLGADCAGVNLALLGFPGNCTDSTPATPFDTQDYQKCVVDHTDVVVANLLDYYYPPNVDFVRDGESKCLRGAPIDASGSFIREIRARSRCLIDQELRFIPDSVNCRADVQPYGPGTGDARSDASISRSYIRLLGSIPPACVYVQINDLDYQSSCIDSTGGIFTIFDLKDCFFDVNRNDALDTLNVAFPQGAVCGDGHKNGDEECDNGPQNSDTNPDACRTNCKLPHCGDNVKDTGEGCDDGNSVDTDCCSNDCKLPACGDGVRQCTEQCDLGSANNSNAPDAPCRPDCKVERCGDGVTDSTEECDDGNVVNNDGCNQFCGKEFCGDSIQQTNEQCDNGSENSDTTPDACRTNCLNPRCGDGVTDSGEECDDANTDDGDGCKSNCKIGAVCGNGILESNLGEECDGTLGNCPAREGCTAKSSSHPCTCQLACPSVGELTLYAGVGFTCSTNDDCPVGTCAEGRCHTVTRLDSGWNGLAHNADINDKIITRGFLDCPSNGPVCGQCNVIGVDSSTNACRCDNNSRTICNSPFAASDPGCPACVGGLVGNSCAANADCTAGTCGNRCQKNPLETCNQNTDCSQNNDTCLKTCENKHTCSSNSDCLGTCTGHSGCDCYFGSPFPLSSGGTPACVLNRFASNVSGTANVDEGSGTIVAHLKTRVFLGLSTTDPCPTCGGKCSNDATKFCDFDTDCVSPGKCNLDPVLNDGVRGGFCIGGDNDKQPCDATAFNSSFPAIPVSEGGGSGLYSLDCSPPSGLNVSGDGLAINLVQTTGTSSLPANLPCDGKYPAVPGNICPCLQCSSDQSVSCTSNDDCTGQVGICNGTKTTHPSLSCTNNTDCLNFDASPCVTLSHRCKLEATVSCQSNTDCVGKDVSPCNPATCSSDEGQGFPNQNNCSDTVCTDTGGGLGVCENGPNSTYCDQVLKSNGNGILSCSTNDDCLPAVIGVDAGNCTLSQLANCFLDPIVGTGQASPSTPIGASTFCIPPTSNSGINLAAGLPGPGRVVNQATAKTFCASDITKQYQPGVGGCLQ